MWQISQIRQRLIWLLHLSGLSGRFVRALEIPHHDNNVRTIEMLSAADCCKNVPGIKFDEMYKDCFACTYYTHSSAANSKKQKTLLFCNTKAFSFSSRNINIL